MGDGLGTVETLTLTDAVLLDVSAVLIVAGSGPSGSIEVTVTGQDLLHQAFVTTLLVLVVQMLQHVTTMIQLL